MAAIAERSVADRLEEWKALNAAVIRMEADGIRRRHPDYDDEQVHRAQVRLRHGDELARCAWPSCELVDP